MSSKKDSVEQSVKKVTDVTPESTEQLSDDALNGVAGGGIRPVRIPGVPNDREGGTQPDDAPTQPQSNRVVLH